MALVRSGKRQLEQARAERQRDKEARRQQRKEAKANAPPREKGAEDPDIAGIIPGPQPILEE